MTATDPAEPTKVTFLGGLGEIGLNCLAIEQRSQMIIIDCGILFPTADMFGVEKYVPDLTYIKERKSSVVGVVLTHGHEDHIGAIPLLLDACPDVTIHATEFTLAILGEKLRETRQEAETRAVSDGDTVHIGSFQFEALPVCHNIPDGMALVITTDNGLILHTGDLKLDPTATDDRDLDLDRLARLADRPGIDLMLGDSTNAGVAGHAESEKSLQPSIERVFADHADRRIICSTFASNVHRHQQFMDAADSASRDIHVLGRSIERTTRLASESGLLRPPRRAQSPVHAVGQGPPDESFILTTGSQAEPRSGLRLMATDQHKTVSVGTDDVVVFSSSRIPGNGRAITSLIDRLLQRGATVLDVTNTHIHATGHACREDLRDLHDTVRARSFVPIHGEHRHLLDHASVAEAAGLSPEQVLVCADGDSVLLSDGVVSRGPHEVAGRVPADDRLRMLTRTNVDDRHYLGRNGVVIVAATLDRDNARVQSTEIRQFGWSSDEDFAAVQDELRDEVEAVLTRAMTTDGDGMALEEYERLVRRATGSFVSTTSQRKPKLVPIVLDIET